MEVHGENSFKPKTYSIAAYKIEQLTVELQTLSHGNIFSINGIGNAIGNKIIEIFDTGKMKVLDELISKTPHGIMEMMKIKGIGPKKIFIIWKEMEIENIGELLYACHENRLSMLKGFGKKTQQNVIDSIEFYQKQQGNYLYAQVEQLAADLEVLFVKIFETNHISITGAIARHTETADEISFVIARHEKIIIDKISPLSEFEFLQQTPEYILYKYDNGIKIKVLPCEEKTFIQRSFETSGSDEFMEAFEKYSGNLKSKISEAKSEEEIFKDAGLQFIPAFLREKKSIIEIARTKIPEAIMPGDIKGIINRLDI